MDVMRGFIFIVLILHFNKFLKMPFFAKSASSKKSWRRKEWKKRKERF
jgi:hypothetical protein